MKKRVLYLFTMLCVLGLTTACSDDDDDDKKGSEVLTELNTSYSDETLVLKYGDSQLVGKEISFNTEDGETATITMKGLLDLSSILKSTETPAMAPGVIPGEVTTTLSNVELTLSGKKYTFEGEDTSNGRTLTYKGEVEKDKLTMDLTVEMPENDLVGTWSLNQDLPLQVVWEAAIPLVIEELELEMPTENIATLLSGIVAPLLNNALQTITFENDGNIYASFKKSGSENWEDSPANLAWYYIKNNKMFVQLNVDMIVQAATKAETSGLTEILGQLAGFLSAGFPLDITIDDDNAAITANTDLVLPLVKLVANEKVVEILMEALAEMEEMEEDDLLFYEVILGAVVNVISETNVLSATLNLVAQED